MSLSHLDTRGRGTYDKPIMADLPDPPPPSSPYATSSEAQANSENGASAASNSAKAAGLTIGLVLVSRLLGILRESVLSYQFGGEHDAAIFRAAFGVPDLIALVIAGGALSSVFIPVFAEYWNAKKEDEAWKMFGSVMTIVAVIATFLVLTMEVFAVPFTHLLNLRMSAPGVIETAPLTRILLPVQICLLIGGLMMGTLYARKRFLVPGLAGLFYNGGMILGGALFGKTLGLSAMAWGALVGAFVGNVALPLWEMRRVGVRWELGVDFQHPGVKQIGRLMVPILLGQSLSQLNMWLTARFLPDDYRLAALSNAYFLTQAPIGIFAQAFGIVLLPTISFLAAQKDWPAYRQAISEGVRRVLFLTIPASLIMAALAAPLIRLFLKQGKFTEDNVPAAATALVLYSLATFAWSATAILSRGFHAMQETRTPVYITTPMVAVFILYAAVYTHFAPSGFLGLAVGTSIVGIATMLLFLVLLQKRVGGLDLAGIARSVGRITVASFAAGGTSWIAGNALVSLLGKGKGGSVVTVLAAGGAGVVVYAALCLVLRVPELRTIRDMFRRSPRLAASGATDSGGAS